MKKNIDLLTEPIFPALTGLALPIMATSLIQMAYNLTDMAWIGQVGANAVAAVGSAGMFVWFSQGVSALAKMGGQVKTAHALGERKYEEAGEYAQGAIQLGIFLGILYGILTVTFRKQLIGFFNMQNSDIVRDSEIYLMITCGLVIFSFMNVILTGLFTAEGDSKTPFKANVVGLVCNMVLDPLLIFGWGPVPALGVSGAAYATVLSQVIVTMIFILVIRKDKILFTHVHLLRKVEGKQMKQIIRIGYPAAIQTMLYSGIGMIITRMISGFGDTAIAVQRVGSQIESISWMTADGFAMAINSFIGQNYGGRQIQRVKDGYRTGAKIMFCWGLFGSCLLIFGAEPIFRIFIHEPDVVAKGVDYLRILGYSQMFMCEEILTVGAFSGLGKTLKASVISNIMTSARIPLAYFLIMTPLGLNGIWWAISLSSIVKGILYVISFERDMRKI